MGRILGIDFGTVRIGLALSDPLGMTAQPLEVIERRRVEPIARIIELIAEHEVQRIVVGQPLRLDGTKGPASEAIEQFVAQLAERTPVPIEMWDERLSTKQAEQVMIAGGARRKTRKGNVDKIAAAVILMSYLEARGT